MWRRPRKLSALKSHNARQGSQGRATSPANMRHRLGHHRPGWGQQRSQGRATSPANMRHRLSHHRIRRRRARSPAPFTLRRHPLTQFRPHRRNGPSELRARIRAAANGGVLARPGPEHRAALLGYAYP